MTSVKACSMCAAARPLVSVVDTTAETADTTIETAAEVTAEVIVEAAIEGVSEETAEKMTERVIKKAAEETTERTAKLMMMLKIESELMTLKTKMIDVDDIFDFENPFLRHVKLAL